MALYRTGTAAMDAQGVITGTGTKWREPLTLIRTGATIVFLTTPLKLAVISDIVSDTEMKAIQTDGEPVVNGNYVILLNDSLTVDGMAQDVAETLRYYQSKETVIEEAIEFFKNFDLKTLQDLVNQIKGDAEKTAADRAATEQLRNETNQIKTDTQNIKDSAVTEITGIKNEALDARDEAENAQFAAEQSKIGADSAKAGAETARDEARQWAQQVNPENLLHKDQNLSDIADKGAARISLQLNRFNQADNETYIQSPDTLKYLSLSNSQWGYYNTATMNFIPLGVQQGGTGANDVNGAKLNFGLDRFVQGTTTTTIKMGDYTFSLVDNGEWGVTKIGVSGWIPLGIGQGGTGSNSPSGARTNMGIGESDVPRFKGMVITGKDYNFTVEGGESNNVNIYSSSQPTTNDWANFTKYNWYNDFSVSGAVRGGSDKILYHRIRVYSPGVDSNDFDFFPQGILTSKCFRGRCLSGGWGSEYNWGNNFIPFNTQSSTNNSGLWSPIIAGGTETPNGYPVRVAFGTLSPGQQGWSQMVLKMIGDDNKHRAYQFDVAGNITSWAQAEGGAWGGAFDYAKNPTSDRDLKEDIKYTEGKESYDRVMQWLPTMFKYKGSDIQRFGLIAQDLLKVDPQYVKLVPGYPIFEDVIGIDEDGNEYVDRQIETDRTDDTLALDSNVMLTDMACAMVYMGNEMESMRKEMEELKAAVKELLSK